MSVATVSRFLLSPGLRLYEAMFVCPLVCASRGPTRQPSLREVSDHGDSGSRRFSKDVIPPPKFLAALHGWRQLERHGRIRPAFRAHRITSCMQMVSGESR